MDIIASLAKEFSLPPCHIKNLVALLDDGKTVPFIARYRKELTGSMNDQTVRAVAERLERIRSVEKRRAEILKNLEEQGVLTESIRKKLSAAEPLATLEDLYRPFRQKRKTRAVIAIERGLSPLANLILAQKT